MYASGLRSDLMSNDNYTVIKTAEKFSQHIKQDTDLWPEPCRFTCTSKVQKLQLTTIIYIILYNISRMRAQCARLHFKSVLGMPSK